MKRKIAVDNNLTKEVFRERFESYEEAENEMNCRYVEDIRDSFFTTNRYSVKEFSRY